MNEIKTLIENSISSLFENYRDSDAVATMESGGFPEKYWRDIYDGGWTRMALPEEDGGAGMGLPGAYLLMRLSGYHAVPLPLVEALLGTYLLGIAGVPIPEGMLTVTIADSGVHPPGGGEEPLAIKRVPWARHAAQIVVLFPGEHAARLALVDRAECVIRHHVNVAGEPRDDVVLQPGAVGKIYELPGITTERVSAWLALGRAAQIAGASFRALERTVGYANERTQFGQLIGKYQAVQQQIAEQAECAHAARCSVDAALLQIDSSQEWESIAAAKIVAGEAAGKVCRIAHAVHAAIGFTQEHSLQLSTRRLWAWRDEYGNEALWAKTLGDLCLGLESGGLWPWLTRQTSN